MALSQSIFREDFKERARAHYLKVGSLGCSASHLKVYRVVRRTTARAFGGRSWQSALCRCVEWTYMIIRPASYKSTALARRQAHISDIDGGEVRTCF